MLTHQQDCISGCGKSVQIMKRFFDNLYNVLYYQFPIDTPAFHCNWPVFSCKGHRTVEKGFAGAVKVDFLFV